tara:strand:+ start:234 stop:725 length:492 start_codon:yes stop_codon:yes gene_type:complete
MFEPQLHKAIAQAWVDGELDDAFSQYGGKSPYFFDTVANPEHPFPFCTVNIEQSTVITRMSGHDIYEHHATVDVPIRFEIWAEQVGSKSAKEVAYLLNEEVSKVFGGHTTETELELNIDGGQHICTMHTFSQGSRMDQRVYMWAIEYTVRVDALFKNPRWELS